MARKPNPIQGLLNLWSEIDPDERRHLDIMFPELYDALVRLERMSKSGGFQPTDNPSVHVSPVGTGERPGTGPVGGPSSATDSPSAGSTRRSAARTGQPDTVTSRMPDTPAKSHEQLHLWEDE